MRTMLAGWRRYRDDPDPRVRARVARCGRALAGGYGAALWAMEAYLARDARAVSQRIRALRLEVERETGALTRLLNHAAGRLLLWSARREARRFPQGRPLEPPTFVDRRNWPQPVPA
jgi:hypothetical protein